MSHSSQGRRRCAPGETETIALNDQRVYKSVSGACGLTGFAVAILAGLAADNPAGVILTRALIAMFSCYFVGIFISALATRAVRDATNSHIRANPAPAIEEVRSAAGANLDIDPIDQPEPMAEAA